MAPDGGTLGMGGTHPHPILVDICVDPRPDLDVRPDPATSFVEARGAITPPGGLPVALNRDHPPADPTHGQGAKGASGSTLGRCRPLLRGSIPPKPPGPIPLVAHGEPPLRRADLLVLGPREYRGGIHVIGGGLPKQRRHVFGIGGQSGTEGGHGPGQAVGKGREHPHDSPSVLPEVEASKRMPSTNLAT